MLNDENLNKLVIGAAQFGSNYGITNKIQISNADINAIINLAKKNKIKHIDTSPDYPGSQKVLSSCDIKDFHIITKLPILKNKKLINFQNLLSLCKNTIKDLKIKKIDTLLLRTPTKILDSNKHWDHLIELKEKKLISKLGYTIYSPDELKTVYEKYKPDVIQLPYSIFDRRFDDTGWLSQLYDDGVEIHVRSIFLQGLLLVDLNNLPKKFRAKKNIFVLYYNWLNDNKYNKLQACLSLPLIDKRISKVLVGLNNLSHFQEILNTSIKPINYPEWMNKIESNIIDPQSWE